MKPLRLQVKVIKLRNNSIVRVEWRVEKEVKDNQMRVKRNHMIAVLRPGVGRRDGRKSSWSDIFRDLSADMDEIREKIRN